MEKETSQYFIQAKHEPTLLSQGIFLLRKLCHKGSANLWERKEGSKDGTVYMCWWEFKFQ